MNYIEDIDKLKDIIKEYVNFIEEHSEAQNKLDKIEELKENINHINMELAEEVLEVSNVNTAIVDRINKIRKDMAHQDEILSSSINWKPASNIFESTIMPEITHTSALFYDPNKEAKRIKQELEKRLSELKMIIPDNEKIKKLEEQREKIQVELKAFITSNSVENLLNKATAERKIILETKYNFMNFLNILQPQLYAEIEALQFRMDETDRSTKSEIESINNELNNIKSKELVSKNIEINNVTALIEKLNANINEFQNNLNEIAEETKSTTDSLNNIVAPYEEKLERLKGEKTNLINKVKELEETKAMLSNKSDNENSNSLAELKAIYELTKTLFNKYRVDLNEVNYYKEELKEQEGLFDLASSYITSHQKSKIEIPDTIQIIKDNEPLNEDLIKPNVVEEEKHSFQDLITKKIEESDNRVSIEENSNSDKFLVVDDKAFKLKNSEDVQSGNLISTDDLAKKIDQALDDYINNSNKNIYVVKAINKICDKFDLRIKIANLAIKRMKKISLIKEEGRNTKIVSKGNTPFTKEVFNVPINVNLDSMSNSYVPEEEVLAMFDFEGKKAKLQEKRDEKKEKLNELKEQIQELKEFSKEKLQEYTEGIKEIKRK